MKVSIPMDARKASSKMGVAFVNNLPIIFSLANSAKYDPSRVLRTFLCHSYTVHLSIFDFERHLVRETLS